MTGTGPFDSNAKHVTIAAMVCITIVGCVALASLAWYPAPTADTPDQIIEPVPAVVPDEPAPITPNVQPEPQQTQPAEQPIDYDVRPPMQERPLQKKTLDLDLTEFKEVIISSQTFAEKLDNDSAMRLAEVLLRASSMMARFDVLSTSEITKYIEVNRPHNAETDAYLKFWRDWALNRRDPMSWERSAAYLKATAIPVLRPVPVE
jgi:hypothetical protein